MKQDFSKIKLLTANQRKFNVRDPQIMKFHNQVVYQCQKYNEYVNQNNGYNIQILNDLFNQIGSDPYIEPNFYCQFGFNISLGDEVFFNHDCTLMDYAPITIGDQANIAPKVGLYTAYPVIAQENEPNQLMIAKPITIQNNVWIGGNTCILGGVTIGNNAIIGAGSVVTQDIPANAVAVGNPAKVIRIIK